MIFHGSLGKGFQIHPENVIEEYLERKKTMKEGNVSWVAENEAV